MLDLGVAEDEPEAVARGPRREGLFIDPHGGVRGAKLGQQGEGDAAGVSVGVVQRAQSHSWSLTGREPRLDQS